MFLTSMNQHLYIFDVGFGKLNPFYYHSAYRIIRMLRFLVLNISFVSNAGNRTGGTCVGSAT